MTENLPRNGMSVRELSQRTGVSTASIIRWTSQPREVYLGRVQERDKEIHKLRTQGLSMREIAAEVGVSARAVHYALHKKRPA
jgi:transposase